MFKFLMGIDGRLYERYLTLERNIKAASNSFYDSFLDFQEHYVKLVATDFDIEVAARDTCGAIMRRMDIVDVFRNKIRVDEKTFGKMQDYVLKVNSHKHKTEKKIQAETVRSYMHVAYYATAPYGRYKNLEIDPFDDSYFTDLFGIFERENAMLKEEMYSMKEELETSVQQHKLKEKDIEAYQNMISQSELEKLSLEEQNHELQKMISRLKDIKLSSMEEKLNRTIDLLLELKPAIEENRIIVRAVGSQVGGLISGDKDVDAWIEAEKEKTRG